MGTRITQQAVEVLMSGEPDVRVTQQAVEVLMSGEPDVRITQQAIEVLYAAITSVLTPEISPISGKYESSQEITIACGTSGATIYYTEDGSDPDNTDTEYTAPFTLGTAKTIKAIGIKSGLNDSNIASETYTIGSASSQQPIIFIIT